MGKLCHFGSLKTHPSLIRRVKCKKSGIKVLLFIWYQFALLYDENIKTEESGMKKWKSIFWQKVLGSIRGLSEFLAEEALSRENSPYPPIIINHTVDQWP